MAHRRPLPYKDQDSCRPTSVATADLRRLSAAAARLRRSSVGLAVRMAVQPSVFAIGPGVPASLLKSPQPAEVLPGVGALRII